MKFIVIKDATWGDEAFVFEADDIRDLGVHLANEVGEPEDVDCYQEYLAYDITDVTPAHIKASWAVVSK